MKDKLCIILQSNYSSDSNDHKRWNAEVIEDSKTVNDTLNEDHDIIEIPILASEKVKQKAITDCIKDVFSRISPHYTACHIVLNTHGAAGRSDLSDIAVKEVVQNASIKKIPVTQVSALLCNGMASLSSKKREEAPVIGLIQASIRGRDSSMSILQQKLKSISTMIPQCFPILGFSGAYDSIKDRKEVISILKGEGDELLQVTTAAPQTSECYVKSIRESLEILRGENPTPAAESILGTALDTMKKNIYDFLQSESELKPENEPLFNSLKTYVLKQYADSSDLYLKINFKKIYEEWKKANKVKSIERIKIFQEHCIILISPSSSPDIGFMEIPFTTDQEAVSTPDSSDPTTKHLQLIENSSDTKDFEQSRKLDPLAYSWSPKWMTTIANSSGVEDPETPLVEEELEDALNRLVSY